MDYSRPPLADRLAAAYVAGTLHGRARRRFEALLPAHPALRQQVAQWQDRLMPLTLSLEPVTPPAAVWPRVWARIGGAAEAAPARMPWWQRLAVWRGLSALSTAAAVVLAVAWMRPPPAQPPVVVVLEATPDAASALATAPGGAVAPVSFVAGISGDGRALVTRPLASVALQPGRVLELWAVPGQGAPASLGLISAQQATVVRPQRLPAGTAALAVSLEPPGGSPTGAPTGPVLYVGKLKT